MSKLLKAILIGAYTSLFIQFLKCLLVNRNVEIVEIQYVLESKSLLGHELLKYKQLTSLIKFDKLERVATDYKYVLKWTAAFTFYNSPIFVNGQRPFLDNNCTYTNCLMTNDKSILADDRLFDAILFDVENDWDSHPLLRSPYQKYVFFASESADNFPICENKTDNYYNLTWTYKIDSDIRWAYVTVLDKNGTVVGPKVDMHWAQSSLPTPDNVRRLIQGKNRTAAWFVSSCQSRSHRQNVTDHIKYALLEYGLEIDVYGWCGKLRCPKEMFEGCLELLQREYYFYLAFENSLAEDYVTEKLMYPLLNYAVPIVYGGANYSRFLPPGSYLDAGAMDAKTIALKMFEAIKYPEIYEDYFRWHNHYSYKKNPESTDLCKLCEILNAPMKFSAKKDFQKWWNTNKERCSLA